jgi:hypothetical protein
MQRKVSYVDSQGRIYLYGEFRPIEHSTFAYNETIAQEYFPLTKEQALKQGYSWREAETSVYKATISSSALPDNIKEAKDEIVKEIIECANCKRAYRVVSAEVTYLNKMKIALPDRCPECRYRERFALRNPIKLWHRQCMKEGCKNEFETPYAPERKEKIYCESCYQQEVV